MYTKESLFFQGAAPSLCCSAFFQCPSGSWGWQRQSFWRRKGGQLEWFFSSLRSLLGKVHGGGPSLLRLGSLWGYFYVISYHSLPPSPCFPSEAWERRAALPQPHYPVGAVCPLQWLCRGASPLPQVLPERSQHREGTGPWPPGHRCHGWNQLPPRQGQARAGTLRWQLPTKPLALSWWRQNPYLQLVMAKPLFEEVWEKGWRKRQRSWSYNQTGRKYSEVDLHVAMQGDGVWHSPPWEMDTRVG